MSSGRSSHECGLLLGRAHEVLDVVEVDARQVRAPRRHRLLLEQPQALEPQVEHPLRLVLERGDVAHDVLGQAAARVGAGGVGVGPAVLVAAEARRARWWVDRRSSSGPLRGVVHDVHRCRWGTSVVQTWSPWAMVARRWTWVPSSSANASVSASHSCGNSAATCATGQWCWQSWSPRRRSGVDARRRSRRR